MASTMRRRCELARFPLERREPVRHAVSRAHPGSRRCPRPRRWRFENVHQQRRKRRDRRSVVGRVDTPRRVNASRRDDVALIANSNVDAGRVAQLPCALPDPRAGGQRVGVPDTSSVAGGREGKGVREPESVAQQFEAVSAPRAIDVDHVPAVAAKPNVRPRRSRPPFTDTPDVGRRLILAVRHKLAVGLLAARTERERRPPAGRPLEGYRKAAI